MNKRIEWVDTAKGIGLLLVILGHLSIPYIDLWIYLFHMPLFFFLSGFVFSGNKYLFKEFLIKKIKTIVIPYFTLGLVIYLFYVIVNAIIGTENGLYGSNSEMLRKFFEQKGFWTVWFLACLFLVEVIYYVIHKFLGKKMWLSTLISLAICVFGLLRYHFGRGALPWNLDVALVAQFFFHTGYCFKNCEKIRNYLLNKKGIEFVLLAIGFLIVNVISGFIGLRLSGETLNMSAGLYGNEVFTFISAFAGIMFTVIVSNRLHFRSLTYLGRNTMIIFAWHSRIVIVLCDYVLGYFGILQGVGLVEQILRGMLIFAVVLAILIPVSELIKRTKIHTFFGV